eukprot:5469007-Amphidinium_carterae.3
MSFSGTLNSNMRHTSPGAHNRAPHDPTPSSTAPSVFMMTGKPTGEKGTSLGRSNGMVTAMASSAAAFSKVNLLHGPPAAARACTKCKRPSRAQRLEEVEPANEAGSCSRRPLAILAPSTVLLTSILWYLRPRSSYLQPNSLRMHAAVSSPL